MIIEFFSSPACKQCLKGKKRLRALIENNNNIDWQEVNVVEQMDHAVDMGVLSTPAIAINGKLVFTGMPSEEQFLTAINKIQPDDTI